MSNYTTILVKKNNSNMLDMLAHLMENFFANHPIVYQNALGKQASRSPEVEFSYLSPKIDHHCFVRFQYKGEERVVQISSGNSARIKDEYNLDGEYYTFSVNEWGSSDEIKSQIIKHCRIFGDVYNEIDGVVYLVNEDGTISSRFIYVVGDSHETVEGKLVKVVTRKGPCVLCDDGHLRYDREFNRLDLGRVVGSNRDGSSVENFKI